MSEPIARIVHASDWHLCHPPHNPFKYFSKRCLAYSACALHPDRKFDSQRLEHWVNDIKQIQPTHIIITGDLSTTGEPREFEQANLWIEQLRTMTPYLAIIPGNHDVYIERKEAAGIYSWLKHWIDPTTTQELYNYRLSSCILGALRIILIDQCRPTPWGNAQGIFTQQMKDQLLELLKAPNRARHTLIVGHYPIHPMHKKSQELQGYELLAECLKGHPNVIYLHGHSHQQHIIDERYFGYPVTIDAGSLCDVRKPSFAVLEVYENSFKATLKTYDPLHSWQPRQTLVWGVEQRT